MAPKKPQSKQVKNLAPKATDEVQGGQRTQKAQSDISSKYAQRDDGIAQNFK